MSLNFNVFNLWAIEIIVFSLNNLISLRICSSVLVSSALVASSKNKISGSYIKALHSPILWISPPDNFTPSSPRLASRPPGSLFNNFSKFIFLIRDII